MSLPEKIGRILTEKRLTVAVAESCTGGLIGAALTGIPGSSSYFAGGVIAYGNRVKAEVLGVSARVLKKHGAVSVETAAAMALGVRRLLHTNAAISVTGIAGPGGGTAEKPVGLVYIGIAVKNTIDVFEFRFRGSRDRIREKSAEEGLKQLIRKL